MKKILFKTIVEIQALTVEKFNAEDEDYPDYRIIRAKEKAIYNRLSKITDDKKMQDKILEIIEKCNWNTQDRTFKPICDKLRELGFEF